MEPVTEIDYDELMALTGHPGWSHLQEFLRREIYQMQADALDLPTWETVLERRGSARGFMFIHNLRDYLTAEESQLAEVEGA